MIEVIAGSTEVSQLLNTSTTCNTCLLPDLTRRPRSPPWDTGHENVGNIFEIRTIPEEKTGGGSPKRPLA
jgi:hypothetical protein